MSETYRDANARAWSHLVVQGEESTLPYGPTEWAHAYEWLDPDGWLPWDEIENVLCLASGGGQQGPLFASIGLRVTVLDLSPAQLATDKQIADTHGLSIECVEGDMLNLAPLYDRQFDLVYQPISTLYIPNPQRLYREVARVLRPRGYYWSEHWNPVQMQLSEDTPWDGEAYRIKYPQGTGEPLLWVHSGDPDAPDAIVTWNYIHSLSTLIGAMCDAGFAILQFGERDAGNLAAEPGTNDHLGAFLPTFFSMLARRRPAGGAH
jgi:SAM-dependent methyltransferase